VAAHGYRRECVVRFEGTGAMLRASTDGSCARDFGLYRDAPISRNPSHPDNRATYYRQLDTHNPLARGQRHIRELNHKVAATLQRGFRRPSPDSACHHAEEDAQPRRPHVRCAQRTSPAACDGNAVVRRLKRCVSARLVLGICELALNFSVPLLKLTNLLPCTCVNLPRLTNRLSCFINDPLSLGTDLWRAFTACDGLFLARYGFLLSRVVHSLLRKAFPELVDSRFVSLQFIE